MRDTTKAMEKKYLEMMQARTPYERFQMGASMHATSKYLITQFILRNNPNISKAELRKELFLKFYREDFDSITLEKILKHIEVTSQSEDACHQ